MLLTARVEGRPRRHRRQSGIVLTNPVANSAAALMFPIATGIAASNGRTLAAVHCWWQLTRDPAHARMT